MLFLCLRFPYLPLEVFDECNRGEKPCGVEELKKIVSINKLAENCGAKIGMSLTTARALIDGKIYSRDERQERMCLHRLSQLAYRFTPTVVHYHDNSLILEVSSSLRLFKGFLTLFNQLKNDLEDLPHDYCYGIAHTEKAAWLLSYQHQLTSIELQKIQHLSIKKIRCQLLNIPVSLLRDFPDILQHLQFSGIKTLGQLLSIPMIELRKRFGNAFVNYLQEITGERVSISKKVVFSPVFRSCVDSSYPVTKWIHLLQPMKKLLVEFSDFLTKHQFQCNVVQWRLYSSNNLRIDLNVSFRHVFDKHSGLFELTQIKLENLLLEKPVETLELYCDQFAPTTLSTLSLFEKQEIENEKIRKDKFQSLITRISSYFDDDSIYRLQLKDSHLPEISYERLMIGSHLSKKELQYALNDRPCWLLEHPQPLNYTSEGLYWNGVLRLLQGPERIETHWWQQAVSRDYFVAIHPNNQRYWVYRDRLKSFSNDKIQWYLHGLFA